MVAYRDQRRPAPAAGLVLGAFALAKARVQAERSSETSRTATINISCLGEIKPACETPKNPANSGITGQAFRTVSARSFSCIITFSKSL